MFFRSERLFLRPAWPEDWNAIHAAIDDEGIVRNLAPRPGPIPKMTLAGSPASRRMNACRIS
jgi:hypothetical protein